MIDFLGDLNEQLASIDEKLVAIVGEVSAMRADLQRLAGKPVMEVYEDWRRKELMSQGIPNEVYVEASVCSSGPKHDFLPHPTDNPEKKLLAGVDGFLEDVNEKQVLLLSGAAGSGKSTATRKLLLHRLGPYTERRMRESGVRVVVLPISLPTLRDPLSSVSLSLTLREDKT